MLSVVRLNLANCFQPEQVYVGLSRVKSLQQLVINGLPSYDKLYNQTPQCPDTLRFLRILANRLTLMRLEEERERAEILERNKEAEKRAAAKKRTAAGSGVTSPRQPAKRLVPPTHED